MSREALAVFARAPVAGRVKSRLAREIGDDAAALLYAAMLRDVLQTSSETMRQRAGACWVAHTPDDAFFSLEGASLEGASLEGASLEGASLEGASLEGASLRTFWDGPRLPQGEGDVGERMLRCLSDLRHGRHGAPGRIQRVVIIGSDSPDLPSDRLHQAFDALKRHDVVLGPAGDGGFYLIGTSRPVPDALFTGVEWSATTTRQAVQRNAAHLSLSCAELAPWNDVDTFDDLHALTARLQSGQSSAPVTTAWLRDHGRL